MNRFAVKRVQTFVTVAALMLTTAMAASLVGATEAIGAPFTCRGERATIVGTPDDDNLDGTRGRDVIQARGGDDEVDAHGGNDVICGGTGEDNIEGNRGHDTIYSGRGNDDIEGGHGRDRMYGGLGNDECDGGPGIDLRHSCHFPT
jgi:Ca2+-binding RTX toxin-like protein